MPWLCSCQFLTWVRLLKLLSGLCLVDLEAKKACSTRAETNHRNLYAHCTAAATHICTGSIAPGLDRILQWLWYWQSSSLPHVLAIAHSRVAISVSSQYQLKIAHISDRLKSQRIYIHTYTEKSLQLPFSTLYNLVHGWAARKAISRLEGWYIPIPFSYTPVARWKYFSNIHPLSWSHSVAKSHIGWIDIICLATMLIVLWHAIATWQHGLYIDYTMQWRYIQECTRLWKPV